MILQLSETLEVPLRDRNNWLVAGGFAPMIQARALDDPPMAQIMGAIRMMLSNHEPFPAVAVDRAWNIRLPSGPFETMSRFLTTDLWSQIVGQRNLMRLSFTSWV